ncbi:unnamed protein product [Brassica oleracea var. botrytis]|uniref:Uncharacterized protein n=3 Tax=Brassica TaxID=3705 RepID=A0A0D3E4W9_BRAOL|nr:unnamed protein product [Brassica napus]CDY19534.1 BnaC09g13690D [Brassica napus]VDD29576.1 unnamed protein product [Brassica oleracea]
MTLLVVVCFSFLLFTEKREATTAQHLPSLHSRSTCMDTCIYFILLNGHDFRVQLKTL